MSLITPLVPVATMEAGKDRKFVEIDRDNFDNVLAGMKPRVAYRVDNKLTDDDTQMAVELRFKSLDDFHPEQVAGQITPVRKLLEARRRLADLLGKLDGNDRLDELLQEIIASTDSLEKLGTDEHRVKILHQGIGRITESDIMLASASDAIVIGFHVDVDEAASLAAAQEGVDIHLYNIIYKLIEDIDKALRGLLEPVYEKVVVGHAEVRAVFRIRRRGNVAGCYVTDGEVTRNSWVRVIRDGEELFDGQLDSLKRFQEDVPEVKSGFECGIGVAGFDEFLEGDVLEFYREERVG